MVKFVQVFIPTKGTELTSNKSQLVLVRTFQNDNWMNALSICPADSKRKDAGAGYNTLVVDLVNL